MDILHDGQADSPHVWQTPASLAQLLQVSERTVWNMLKRGELEREKASGRTYCRKPENSEASEFSPQQEFSPERNAQALKTELVALQGQLVEVHREAAATTERLRERAHEAETAVLRAEADLREAHLLADVAVRDVERLQSELAEARRVADIEQARLATERQRVRLLERAAQLPWYAWRRRRQLFEQAARVEVLEALPAS